MGARGPKPGSGGRPKKPLDEKILEGNLGKRPLKVLKKPDGNGAFEVPQARDYLSEEQKNGEKFFAEDIRGRRTY